MTRNWCGSTIRAGIMVAMCALLASPVYAQLGSLKGRVVDEAGKPVPDAEITFEYSGEMNYRFTGKSDSKGEWIRAGLYAVGGLWTVSAKKGTLAGFVGNIDVPLSAVGEVGDIVIRVGGAVAARNAGSEAEAERIANEQAALKTIFDEANAALASNSYDVALAKLAEALTKVKSCAACHARMGDVYSKKQDLAAAEEAYKKAIASDPKSAEAYDGLAILYNSQKKFAEAAEASKKATELYAEASGGAAGGGGDATSAYNSGAIFMNQGKVAEAKAAFQRAIALDPKMAEAHYQLAMTLLNEGNMKEAVTSLEQYLSLAPTGPNAEGARGMLVELKKMM